MKNILILLLSFVMLFSLVNANIYLSDQGTDVTNSSGSYYNGSLKVSIYTTMTGGTPIYSETFSNAIVNGSWNVMLGLVSNNLTMDYSGVYYKDYEIDGEDFSFTLDNGSTVGRLPFYAPMGAINWSFLQNYPTAGTGAQCVQGIGDTLTFFDTSVFNDSSRIDDVNSSVSDLQSANVSTNIRVDDLNSSIGDLQTENITLNTRVDDVNSSKVNRAGDNMTGMLNITNNALALNKVLIKNLDEKNGNISGPAVGVFMTGPSGEELPHMIIQSGGGSQASVMLRSLMIANEIAGFHNTSNATDCVAYMNEIGEVLKIDCNTTTTGADLLVSDDMQVVGDTWFKDSKGDWHYMTRTLSEIDKMNDNIIFNKINVTISGSNFSFKTDDGSTIVVNLDKNETILTKNNDSVLLNTGTDANPVMNYIYYKTSGNPTLEASSTPPTDHADVGNVLIGSSGNIYGHVSGTATNEEFIHGVYHRFYDQGALYISGFTPTSDYNSFNVSSGSYKLLLNEIDATNNLEFDTDGYFFIKSNGTYVQSTSLSDITEYSDGTSISSGMFVNVVWGVVPTNTSRTRLMAIIQDYPGSGKEYGTKNKAEQDIYQKTVYFPSQSFLKKLFLPIARTIVKVDTDEFATFKNGYYHLDLRGRVQGTFGGAPPSPSITSHADLDDLDYASSGHTGFCSAIRADDLNSSIGDLQTDNVSTNVRIDDLNSSISDLQTENVSLNTRVDDLNISKVDKTGDTMTGVLSMDSADINMGNYTNVNLAGNSSIHFWTDVCMYYNWDNGSLVILNNVSGESCPN